MKHLYIVNPVEHQPHWDTTPQPIQYPWERGLLAAVVLAAAFVAILGLLGAVGLLGCVP